YRVLRLASASPVRLAPNPRPTARVTRGQTAMIAAGPGLALSRNGETGPRAWGSGDGSSPISLRVRDLASSRKFYSEVLGFVAATAGYSDASSVLVSPLLASGFRSIV